MGGKAPKLNQNYKFEFPFFTLCRADADVGDIIIKKLFMRVRAPHPTFDFFKKLLYNIYVKKKDAGMAKLAVRTGLSS